VIYIKKIQQKHYEKYADVKKQIKELTNQAKELENEIKEEMKIHELDKIKSDWGTFSLSVRKTWTYSPAVDEIKKNLKEMQFEETENGKATCNEKEVLTFRGIK
jgi:predicted phage-related endonuclease